MIRLIVFFIVCLPIAAHSACSESPTGTWTPDTLTVADVELCLDDAGFGDGELIALPSGSANWSGSVDVDRPCTIQGAGMDVTNITDTSTGSVFATAPFSIDVNTDDFVEISNMTLVSNSTDTYNTYGLIYIGSSGLNTTGNNFRIHHVKFDDLQDRGIWINHGVYGLVDNCEFYDTGVTKSVQPVSVFGKGDADWTTVAFTPGTANAVYFEDNTVDFGAFQDNDMVEGYQGARYVSRYNTINGAGQFGHHGRDSASYRSTHTYEIYENAVVKDIAASVSRIGQSRGGTGVVFNNTIVGTYTADQFELNTYRSCPQYEGTVDSGSSTLLTDADGGFSWPDSNLDAIYNMTDGSMCRATSATSTSATCSGGLSGGDDNTFQVGDSYSIFYDPMDWGSCNGLSDSDGNTGYQGYPCADQNGRTTSQVYKPVYAWGNTVNGAATDILVGASCARSQAQNVASVDYFNCDSAADCKTDTETAGYTGWTYVPYTYPHPLRGTNSRTFNGIGNFALIQEQQ